ncbi:DNA mismatch repair protein Mlh1 [Trichinella britovi]|uniref:DNA mismatch repair protein Mlh1 n=1 Tax=Trichinella britovi TaxID=45882 RepID=A0A0V1DDN9_TRIBR|nr:DNA mismatch repair protein Mlh1 [Trichinella britovi]
MNSTRPIKPLKKCVIDRIAAGEVILTPMNVVKELMENSVDAGANQINISISGGGLKLIRIQDNGCGIRRDDFSVVCQRHATSKLEDFTDLLNISTLGFRGEALSSICCVAHVTVTSKTLDSVVGYECRFNGEKMTEPPKALASNQGTVISVENLFYNNPVRQKLMKNSVEEWNRIVDLVAKFAIHFTSIGFSLKREDRNISELKTTAQGSTNEKLATCFGSSVAKELIAFDCTEPKLGFKAKGLISSTSYSSKKFTLCLFINNRLVECLALKRGFQALYSNYLPKQCYPFIYISMEISPHLVDVNLHPTKAEISFMNESEIVENILQAADKTLLAGDKSRSFLAVQTVRPKRSANCDSFLSTSLSSSVQDCHIVRVDCNDRKLDEFLDTSSTLSSEQILLTFPDSVVNLNSEAVEQATEKKDKINSTSLALEKSKTVTKRVLNLTSVFELQQQICENSSVELRNLFRTHTFVGCINPKLTLMQSSTSLYMIDMEVISEELFYQILITRFGNLDSFRMIEPVSIRNLLNIAIRVQKASRTESSPSNGISQQNVDLEKAVQLFNAKAQMLWDYFALEIKDDYLISLPMLVKNYLPQIEGLPHYLMNLLCNVNWFHEKECFDTFARQTAKFYSLKATYCSDELISPLIQPVSWKWTIENVLCRALKAKFLPPTQLVTDRKIFKLTDLPELYKIFEPRNDKLQTEPFIFCYKLSNCII